MKTKIVLCLIVIALLLSACSNDYSIVNMPDDEQCEAAGYAVSVPLAGMASKAACAADALDDGVLNHSNQ